MPITGHCRSYCASIKQKGRDLRGLFSFEETRADIGECHESSKVITHSFGYQLDRGIGAVPICSS
jgi:hypothetical protein